MKVFLIRHAESELNRSNTHQYPHTKLSKTGLRQAELLAERFSGAKVDLIIASRYTRAMQTARILQKRLKKRIVYTSLLNELKRPSEVEGKSTESKIALRISAEFLKHFYDPGWHYSDEENFFDLRRRASAFIKYLKKKNKGSIAVVTHGHVIRMLLALAVFGENMSMDDCYKFFGFVRLDNTGITECEFTDGKWRLLRLNDHAHLRG